MLEELNPAIASQAIADTRATGYSMFGGIPFVFIPSGKFPMGSPKSKDQFICILTEHYWMARTPITQQQWLSVMGGDNPSYFPQDFANPVEQVSLDMANEFCAAWNKQNPNSIYEMSLPTEAQWEGACRGTMFYPDHDDEEVAASSTEFHFGDDETELTKYAWFNNNAQDTTHPVGLLLPNQLGLYDMHGNVWEWCIDSY